MLDLLIAGGTVLDGSGGPPRRADVGIRDGRIVPAEGPAAAVLDAGDLMVAPGFVDLHTHYDAQLAWDPTASPSPLHGATTVMGGNCGFSLAPAGPAHADYLMRMMAKVEGIPLAALEKGLAWDWEGFGQWLGRFDGAIGVNAGFLVGHSALRRVVMGDDAVGGATTEGTTAAMVALLHEALAAGAMGFSTSQVGNHHDGDGNPVPSRSAANEELLALSAAVRDHPGTTLELILPGCINGFSEAEVELMTAMSVGANRPANWNVLGVSAFNPRGYLSQLEASDRAAEGGGRVAALVLSHSMRIRLSFFWGTVLEGLPGWRSLFAVPVEERLKILGEPSARRRLGHGAASPDAGVLGALANWKNMEIVETFAPENEGLAGRRVGEIARARGAEPFDTLVDIAIADGLRTGFRPPGMTETDADWELRAAAWRDPRTIVGGSDAGAHLDMMCGAVYSTTLLASVRDHHTVTWEEAVRLLADEPARFYGLDDRGRIAPGNHADIVVFDPERVGPSAEETRNDLPGGASRIYAGSQGVEHVLVNGTAVVTEGRLTGATPGDLLRSGRDSTTVTP